MPVFENINSYISQNFPKGGCTCRY